MEPEKSLENRIENTSRTPTLWARIESTSLSPLALQDFGKYLMDRPEHREGKMTCVQISLDEPLEVTFFGDSPDADDVFHIIQDNGKKAFVVVTLQGDSNRIDALLMEFGFFPFVSSTQEITPQR